MSTVTVLTDKMTAFGDKTAFWYDGRTLSFREFIAMKSALAGELAACGIAKHDCVLVSGDIDPQTIALLLNCIESQFITVPHLRSNDQALAAKVDIASVQWRLEADASGHLICTDVSTTKAPPTLYSKIVERDSAGLVLFTSGSSGEPKAAVHDIAALFEKFDRPRKALRTIGFLLFDHWGGLNTIFHTLFNGGELVCLTDRAPSEICRLIETTQAELLPVSPSFLNMLLASREYEKWDLSSLSVVSYGAEPMAQHTLDMVREILPSVAVKQTYGLIELGVFPTRSSNESSLFFQIDNKSAQYRIVDGMLQLKTAGAMLGYINAPSPFTEDGWFITGDQVEVRGDEIRVLGRKTEIINVGGEKVYPSEVEAVLVGLDGVVDALVYGEKNFLLGNIVCAEIYGKTDMEPRDYEAYVKQNCRKNLEEFKVPVKLTVIDHPLHGERLKKSRLRTTC